MEAGSRGRPYGRISFALLPDLTPVTTYMLGPNLTRMKLYGPEGGNERLKLTQNTFYYTKQKIKDNNQKYVLGEKMK